MLVLGISGSLRRDSHNRQLLHAAAGVRPSGVEFKEWRGLAALPAYDADLDDGRGPAAAGEMRAAFAGADALLISTPEYNASVPGALKNAIDWASRPFPDNALRDKPVAVVGASTGLFGAVWAQAELRKALATAGARPLDTELPVASAHEAFDDQGSLRATTNARRLPPSSPSWSTRSGRRRRRRRHRRGHGHTLHGSPPGPTP